MKTLIAAVFGMAALGASASATISDVIVRQQWPWNGKVNIDYVLSDPEEGEHDITVVMSNGLHVVTNEYGSLSGDIFGVKPGARRIVWDPSHNGATYSEKVMPNFSVTLSTPDDNSRKFMILDLSGEYAADAPIPVSFASAPPEGGWNTDEYKTTKMVLRRIPAGTFIMGSPEGELGHSIHEDFHPVTFTKDFYVALFMCSVHQFAQIYTGNASALNNKSIVHGSMINYACLRGTNSLETVSANFPNGTWPNCDSPSFFATLNARAVGSLPAELTGWKFDLLSSSQWEYACRAGTSSTFYNGATITNKTLDANASLLGIYKNSPTRSTGPTSNGAFLPNGFGLYDMCGSYGDLVKDTRAGGNGNHTWTLGQHQVDPLAYRPDNYRTIINRGGNWRFSEASSLRSAATAQVGGAYGSSVTASTYKGLFSSDSDCLSFRVALVYIGE